MLDTDHPMEEGLGREPGIYARGSSVAAREGVMSFLKKRPPLHLSKRVSTTMPGYFPWWTERKDI
jgi:hypothetical protein